MSLFTSVVLPMFEKELIALEPEIASFLVAEIEKVFKVLLNWIELKAKPAALKEPEK